MMVQAKCVQKAWDSTRAQEYTPAGGPLTGGLYELDLANPAHRKLVDLKTQMGEFIFQFDRAAANNPSSGLYFCLDCGERSDSLNQRGNHTKQVHKKTGWNNNEHTRIAEDSEPEEDDTPNKMVDRRGKVPVTCKGCGQSLTNIGALAKHKKTCPSKTVEVVAPEVIEEVAQAPPA